MDYDALLLVEKKLMERCEYLVGREDSGCSRGKSHISFIIRSVLIDQGFLLFVDFINAG